MTYTRDRSLLVAKSILQINAKVAQHGASYAQQYMLPRGLKTWGEKGAQAAQKELDQLHRRNCFTPIDVKAMTPSERRKAQEALMFLT